MLLQLEVEVCRKNSPLNLVIEMVFRRLLRHQRWTSLFRAGELTPQWSIFVNPIPAYHMFPLHTAAHPSGRIALSAGMAGYWPAFAPCIRCDTMTSLRSIDSPKTSTMRHRAPGIIVAVVDDDRRVLESLENLLSSAGHAVRLFDTAGALLESGSLAEVDCLISDIDLPRIDGFELLRLAHEARPELPVILITGQPKMMDRSPPVGSGHYRLFKKPFDGQELLAAVGDTQRT